jgi:hypothetical protein
LQRLYKVNIPESNKFDVNNRVHDAVNRMISGLPEIN